MDRRIPLPPAVARIYEAVAELSAAYPGRSFDDVEADLSRDWETRRGSSSLEWDDARDASRDAWQRVSDRVERATVRAITLDPFNLSAA